MSKPRPPQPAKLVISVLLADKALLGDVLRQLQSDFGTIDLKSPWMDFGYTDYYFAEMGGPLFRRMLAFGALIQQQALSRVKLATNVIEQAFAQGQRRQVNIDPGYLLLERFVLATGKNFSHRIYIGDAIYADLTLIYQKGGFQTLPWTYPDYAAAEMHLFLSQVRNTYAQDLKASPAKRDGAGG
jgi:ribosomal silencing factor RsfS